jgi:hypothetical protein
MKTKWINITWGVVLVLAGGIFLAQNMGWVALQSLSFWMLAFAGASLLFFVTYFVDGVQKWGWLFPACILGGVAATMALANAGMDDAWIGAPVLVGCALPFLVAYLVDRRGNWWALIPTWVLAVVSTITIIVDRMPDEWIGTLVMWGIGLPFLVVYLTDRSRWWALIPGGILVVIGVIPALTTFASENLVGAFVMLVISLPFFVVYFARQENWWALIPAGILASLGVVALLSGPRGFEPEKAGWLNGVLFLGAGLTFALLWLRRSSAPTEWARYPALVLLLVGLLALALGQGLQGFLWPIVIIALGIWVLLSALRPKRQLEE